MTMALTMQGLYDGAADAAAVEAALRDAAQESWSASRAGRDGVPYRYDNGPWPPEDRFFRFADGSVAGLIRSARTRGGAVRVNAY